MHAWHVRRLTDLPVTGRSLMIELRVRRLVCQTATCPQRTFREQVPGLALRYARRTLRLTAAVGQLAITLAGACCFFHAEMPVVVACRARLCHGESASPPSV
jgi:hypothetical protein